MRPPGPSAVEMIVAAPRVLRDRLAWAVDVHREHGDVVAVPLGLRTLYSLSHPDLIRHVLVGNVKNYRKGTMFDELASLLLGNGLATSEGARWQRQRRWMNPHFHREALAGLVEAMLDNIDLQLGRWHAAARTGEVMDLARDVYLLSGNVVARALLGAEIEESEVRQMARELKWAVSHLSISAVFPIPGLNRLPFPWTRRLARTDAMFHDVIERAIRRERARAVPASTLIAKMVRAQDPETGESIEDREIYDEVIALLLGGMDTSGDTLFWTLYNLARHPDARARARGEVDALGGRRPSYEDLPKLSYVRRVIDETLRLYPPSWATARQAIGDDRIGGYDIPAGSHVALAFYVAHRRPDFWDEPEAFDPDRFLPERVHGHQPSAYFPFGAGQRKCIGAQFALIELTLTLALVLDRFDLEFADLDGVTAAPLFSLAPKAPVSVRIRERR